MSVNYAAGLSDYPHKGKCGQPEFADADDDVESKVEQLADLIHNSKHCVVLTGAGISTSTGIPDFRGPKGVWTLEEKGVEPTFATTFDDAKASYAHMALVALERCGYVKFLVTQNVDGLHIRSGFPRDRMSILHGDMFTEQCDKCSHLKMDSFFNSMVEEFESPNSAHNPYIRNNCVTTMGLKYTGNSCTNKSRRGMGCRGRLRDTILDWEDTLPDNELDAALDHSKKADVYLVLGSSLQIVPAGNLPLHCRKTGGKFISVNLQKTKHHKKTDIIIHSYIDRVMRLLCGRLGVAVSTYTHSKAILHSTHCSEIGSCLSSNISTYENTVSTSKPNAGKQDKANVKTRAADMKCRDTKRTDLKRKSQCVDDIIKKELKVDT